MSAPADKAVTDAGTLAGADWASDPVRRPDGRPWDLLVVGGGTAGLVATHTAATLGAHVLMVERDRTGGDCLWTGCVPSKSLLAAASAAATARGSASLGIHAGDVRVDFGQVMAHVRGAIAAIEPVDSPEAVRRTGAAVARGTLSFTGPGRAEVDGQAVAFRQALVATGSEPVVPDLPGMADAGPLTSDTVWELEELPPRLLVLGGGPVGCELGQAFARLGSQVTLAQRGGRVLAKETGAASEAVGAALRHDGVDLRTRTSLVAVERDGDAWAATLEGPGGRDRVGFDRVLVAVGRRARVAGLGLDRLGVRLDAGGHVATDDRLRTSHPRVWAAGDVTGHPPFTHLAGVHGSLAASNAVLGLRRTVSPGLVPRVTYTDPEVAAFGAGADDPGPGHTLRTVSHDAVDRAVTQGETDGRSVLVLDGRGRVVGASLVGPRAGESLAEVVLAAGQGLRARDLAGSVHAYPTWADGVWKAALAQGRADLGSPVVQRAVRTLAGVRRWWVSRAPGRR